LADHEEKAAPKVRTWAPASLGRGQAGTPCEECADPTDQLLELGDKKEAPGKPGPWRAATTE